MRVLITGAAGFIGSQLVKSLQHGFELVGIDDLSTGNLRNLDGLSLDFRRGSILDTTALNTAARDCNAIVHLAARPSVPRSIADPMASHAVNTTGTLNVLEVARSLTNPLVIVASSSSVYGGNPAIPKSEDLQLMPLSPYAVSKLAAEQYSLAWTHSYGIRTLALRFFNVFGPHQPAGHAYAAVVPAFVHAALTGSEIIVHGDGNQTRDFTYVGTVCEVIKEALLRNVSCTDPVNLAFGTNTSINDLILRIETILNLRTSRRYSAPRPSDVRHSQANDAKLRSLFPDVRPVQLDHGLEETIAWMQRMLRS